jgi:DNA-binding CsgD family transcriptional regulator
MALSQQRESELLDLLYAATGEPALWTEFLAQLSQHLAATSWTGFIAVDPSLQTCSLNLHFGMPPDVVRQYNAYYWAFDPWFLAYKAKNQRGWIGNGSDLCPPSEFERTEFYNDFFRFHHGYHQTGIIIENGGGRLTVLTALRPRDQSDFDAGHVECLEKLSPHLTRALHMHGKMLELKHAASAAASVVDTLDVALVGLDADGKVCFLNSMAESLLRSGEILRLQGGRIVPHDAHEAEALKKLIETACTRELESLPGGAITLHKGHRSLYLTVLPYTASNDLLPDRTKVFLSITDPDARPKSRSELLVALFHLTPAESRIAMLLASGEEPTGIAARTRSSYATVRSHLKSIYQKTNVSKQSQLVRLISMLPGQL